MTSKVFATIPDPMKAKIKKICIGLGISEAEFVRASISAQLKRKSREVENEAN
jgi:hypothetical protein